MPYFLGPRQIRNMDQPVNARFDLNEDAEISQRLNLTGNPAADRMTFGQLLPRIGFGLLKAKRDPAIGLVDSEHLYLDMIANIYDFGRMYRALAPRHLGNVNQPLDAFFEFDESAIVSNADYFAAEAGADWIALCRLTPRIGHDLFHPERHPFARRIVLEDYYLDFVADLDHLRGA